jgi:hypothetical protein
MFEDLVDGCSIAIFGILQKDFGVKYMRRRRLLLRRVAIRAGGKLMMESQKECVELLVPPEPTTPPTLQTLMEYASFIAGTVYY